MSEKTSDLPFVTLPIDGDALIEVSTPTGGSPAYISEKTLFSDLLNQTLENAVIGPASSIDNRLALFDGATGKLIKDSGVLLSSVLVSGGALGTPSSGTLTNASGLPIGTGVSGLGAGVATFLSTPSSANLASAVTGETGSGAVVFGTGPTITTLTLTGTTTIPDSGEITTAGELGLGAAAAGARLSIGGTFVSAGIALISVGGTFASSVTSTQRVFNFFSTIAPSGASLTSIDGILCLPTLNSTSFTITSWNNVRSTFTLGASFSGVITTANLYNAFDPTVSGGSITNLVGYSANIFTNGDGITSGTKTNRQFRASGITAGAAGGTINNRGIEIVVPSGGASSGTANNRGIYITGNGGTAAGGAVNNFAIYDESTARNYLEGQLSIGTTTDPGAGNLLVNGTIKPKGYTVATLPAAGTAGRRAYVTDALAPAFLAAVAGGGAAYTPVQDTGAAWVCA